MTEKWLILNYYINEISKFNYLIQMWASQMKIPSLLSVEDEGLCDAFSFGSYKVFKIWIYKVLQLE